MDVSGVVMRSDGEIRPHLGRLQESAWATETSWETSEYFLFSCAVLHFLQIWIALAK